MGNIWATTYGSKMHAIDLRQLKPGELMEDGGISTSWRVNYKSKKHPMDSQVIGLSLDIRQIERTIVRSPSGRETLCQQKPVKDKKDGTIAFLSSQIPDACLATEERCRSFVTLFLREAKVNEWTRQRIFSKICKDLIDLGEEGKKGFLVEAEVQVVKETLFDNKLSASDYDYQLDQDCPICLEELSSDHGQRKIMELPCSHNFHKDCILQWLHRNVAVNRSCPYCRSDIEDPQPSKIKDGVHRLISSLERWIIENCEHLCGSRRCEKFSSP